MASTFAPNGLRSNEETCAGMVVDQERWSTAEARVSELVEFIKPSQESETRRNAVISYIQHLLMRSVPCQVFTSGSVPLKTYLPDGDIDLTVFGDHQFLHDPLIFQIFHILLAQQNSHNSQFQVKDVRFIQPEVRIIKCIVDIFVVDISFNQLSGLCALCFFEEISALISHDHLFKRSIILIKAWCYYESRILGSNHGLISTYALEILVLYIFNLYNNRFSGPLEVLYRFLDFFSKFDWETYCISLRGPVPIVSLPNMIAEPPRKDCQDLLLPEWLLNNYVYQFGYMPCIQGYREQGFVSKHINVIDPLRANNNLGRSISKGNFLRIRSAIALGATQLGRLLDCSEENLLAELDFFFKNTWNRHGNGHWVHLHFYNFYLRHKNAGKAICQESEVEQAQASHSSQGICPKADNSMGRLKSFGQTSNDQRSDYCLGVNGNIGEAMGMNIGHNGYLQAPRNMISSGASFPLHASVPDCEYENSFGAVPVTIPNRGSLSNCNMFCSQDFPILEGIIKQEEITEPKDHSMKANSAGTNLRESKTAKTPASYAGILKGTVSACNSSVLDTQVVVGSRSSEIASNNQSLLPHAFGSCETRFPFQHCNLPTETGTSNIELQNHSDTSHVYYICQDETSEYSVTESFDILIGDYRSYLMNLQYGRVCQNAELNRPLFYPPTNAPPLGFLEQLPWNRRPPGSMNFVARGALPEMPRTLAPPLREVTFWLPRFSDGTGSFIPNLPSYRQRHNSRRFSSHRQDQGPRNLHSNLGERCSSSGQVHYRRAEKPGTSTSFHQGECSNSAVNKLAKSKGGSG